MRTVCHHDRAVSIFWLPVKTDPRHLSLWRGIHVHRCPILAPYTGNAYATPILVDSQNSLKIMVAKYRIPPYSVRTATACISSAEICINAAHKCLACDRQKKDNKRRHSIPCEDAFSTGVGASLTATDSSFFSRSLSSGCTSVFRIKEIVYRMTEILFAAEIACGLDRRMPE